MGVIKPVPVTSTKYSTPIGTVTVSSPLLLVVPIKTDEDPVCGVKVTLLSEILSALATAMSMTRTVIVVIGTNGGEITGGAATGLIALAA